MRTLRTHVFTKLAVPMAYYAVLFAGAQGSQGHAAGGVIGQHPTLPGYPTARPAQEGRRHTQVSSGGKCYPGVNT